MTVRLLIASILLSSSLTARAAEPFIEKLDLFEVGKGGYALYHIPGVVVTAKGTVLAWCEGRQKGGDWDQIEILLRRSADDGRTWSDATKIANVPGPKPKNPFALAVNGVKPDDVTYNNPVLIADRDGTVHCLFCLEYMRCFYQRSADDGVTWGAPTEITAAFDKFRPAYDWKVLATGPNHGIQLKGGRLVVPVWLSTGTGGNAHRPSVTATIYSDDQGKTWHAGQVAVPCTDEWVNPNETAAVELADGRVMLNVRSESKAHRRLVTASKDGANGWSTPTFDDALVEPICMGGLVRYSLPSASATGRILFSNPDNLTRADGKESPGKPRDRKNLTVKLSDDEGKTWAVSRPVEPGWSAYSDLAVTRSGTILCFYGRGTKAGFAGDRLTLARFNLEWLTESRGVDAPTTAPTTAPSVRLAPAGLPPLSGIVLDDGEGVFTGEWVKASKQPPRVGDSYRHDANRGQGQKQAKFTPQIPAAGAYEVRVLYTANPNRSSKVPVTVHAADGERTVVINQKERGDVNGVPVAAGVFNFAAGRDGFVVISNAGADGFVVVDAVQFVPVDTARAEREAAAKNPIAVARRPAATTRPAAATPADPAAAAAAKGEPVQLAAAARPAGVNGKTYDLVVVGGTGGGLACAVRAAREGLAVLIVQHDQHLGGMMTNGLVQWDALYGGRRSPLFSELLTNIEAYYRTVYGEGSADFQAARYGQHHYPMGMVEPHVVEREYNRLVAGQRRITVLLGHYPVAVDRDGAMIRSVTLRPRGTPGDGDVVVRGTVFADATYEADLAALAKVPYRVGREARDEYKEPHAGKIFTNLVSAPSPRDAVEGRLNLRPYNSRQGTIDPSGPFTADRAIQAYNYRFCVTRDPANRILLTDPPPNYRREEFVHFDRKSIGSAAGPNRKSHMNSPILTGENHAYPDADRPTRDKITQRHLEFALGLMYFLQNDESVPAAQREKFREWGLPKDEYPDHGHVPYEMYVRETRRIVGRHVYTEHDNSVAPGIGRTPVQPDAIAITDWYMDSHACTLETRPGYHFDGKLILTEQSRPGQIPYRALLPRDVDNLLVPICVSSTHVAWGAVRLEPVFLHVGEAAGLAAAIAVQSKTAPAGIDADLLVRRLAAGRAMTSFFNDVDVASDAKWVPAVEYFGTKGMFETYDARPDQPLTRATAAVWVETFAKLASREAYDPTEQARKVARAATVKPDAGIPAHDFAEQLNASLARAGRKRGLVADPSVGGPDAVIARAAACQLMDRALHGGN